MNRILVLTVALTFCTSCAAQEASVEKLLAQSESAIQTRIGKVSDALNQSSRDPQNNIEARQEIVELIDSVADKGEIVKQVAIFAATPGEQQPLKALAILQLLDLSPSIVIQVLAPYLNADDIKVRSFVLDWFQSHDNGGSDESPLKPVNYADYVDYVRRKLNRNEDVPKAFIEYIYERSPGRALFVFYHAARQGDEVTRLLEMRNNLEAEQQEREKEGQDTLRLPHPLTRPLPPLPPVTNPPDVISRQRGKKLQKEILLAEHVVSNVIWLKKNKFGEEFDKALPGAKEQLLKLSKHEQWWVRLYVAEIVRQHHELRLADVLDKLTNDGNSSGR